jgi:hypothetical protein
LTEIDFAKDNNCEHHWNQQFLKNLVELEIASEDNNKHF